MWPSLVGLKFCGVKCASLQSFNLRFIRRLAGLEFFEAKCASLPLKELIKSL